MTESIRTAQRSASPLAIGWAEGLPRKSVPAGGPAWLGAVRERAAEAFREHGLPGNKDEAWKYTSLRRLETLAPALREGGSDTAGITWSAPLADAGGYGFRWIDGRVDISDAGMPEGVSLWQLGDALSADDGGIGQRLRDLLESLDVQGRSRAFEALNTALLGTGVVIHVEAGIDAGRCDAHWVLPAREGSGLHNARLCILLEPGARLQLVEQHCRAGLRDGQAQARSAQALNLLFQANLAAEASLDHVRV